jgi:hypothetical protein
MLLGVLCCAGGATGAGWAGSPAEALGDWTAVAFSGRVEARPAGGERAWHLVLRGDVLPPSTELRTGTDARATLVRGDGVLSVDPDSRVALGDGADTPTVEQQAGSVVYEIERGRGDDFEVVTPFMTATTSGTAVSITVGDGFASAAVERGQIEIVNRHGDRLELRGGGAVLQDGSTRALRRIALDPRLLRAEQKSAPYRRPVVRATPPAPSEVPGLADATAPGPEASRVFFDETGVEAELVSRDEVLPVRVKPASEEVPTAGPEAGAPAVPAEPPGAGDEN